MPKSQENAKELSIFYKLSRLNSSEKPNNTSSLNKLLVKMEKKNNYSENNSQIKNSLEIYLNKPKEKLSKHPRFIGYKPLPPAPPTQAPTPIDPAKSFHDALAKALSSDDLDTLTEKLALVEIPRDGETYSGRFRGEIQGWSDISLVNRIKELEESILDLPTVPAYTQAMLTSLLEEAKRREVDFSKFTDSKNPINTPLDTTITVSQMFPSRAPGIPSRPVTGVEHETTEVLVRKRENLEKSGLPKDIIDVLRKTIDQELIYRESNPESNA